jgi:hypothetical protein
MKLIRCRTADIPRESFDDSMGAHPETLVSAARGCHAKTGQVFDDR